MSASTRALPNILIIYPDQLRADALGCAGNPCIKTPHIDRLANEGVKFDNAFTSFVLFDLKNDPNEMENLAGLPAYQKIQAELDGWLQAQMSALGDDWSKEAPFPPQDFQSHAEGTRYAQELRKSAIQE
jgi:hypothetical protein